MALFNFTDTSALDRRALERALALEDRRAANELKLRQQMAAEAMDANAYQTNRATEAARQLALDQELAGDKAANRQAQDVAFAWQNSDSPKLNPFNGQPYSPTDPALMGMARSSLTNLGSGNITSRGLSGATALGNAAEYSSLEDALRRQDLASNPYTQRLTTEANQARLISPVLGNQRVATETSRIVPESEARIRGLDAQRGLTEAETNARRFLPFQSSLLELNPEGRAVSLQTPPSVETLTTTNRFGLPEQRKVERPYQKTLFATNEDADAFNSQAAMPAATQPTTALPSLVAPSMSEPNPMAAVAQENKLNRLSALASVMRDAQARVAGQGQISFNPQGGFRGGGLGGMGGGYYQPMAITNPPLATDELARQLKRYQDAARMMGTLR